MNAPDLLAALHPLLQRLQRVDVNDPREADALNAEDSAGDWETPLAAARAALDAGWLCPREAGPHVRYGRLCKATPDSLGFSIDAVVMDGAAPGAHTHTGGEIDLCLPLDGAPRFDGHAERWLIYPPGSRHTPTVAGGKMLILYFLPGGQIRFE